MDFLKIISIFVYYRNDDDRLAQINAVFRTIDLASLSLAPLIAGLIFDLISTYAAAYFIAGWNLVSVVFEYLLLRYVHSAILCANCANLGHIHTIFFF
jgi:hypothetical protein